MPEDVLQDRDRFLSYFPPEQRKAATRFLRRGVNAGCHRVEEVVFFVFVMVTQYARGAVAHRLRQLVFTDAGAVRAGARWLLWVTRRKRCEDLPDQRTIERFITERRPTEQQLKKLHRLGYRGPAPKSLLEAYELIEALTKRGEHASC